MAARIKLHERHTAPSGFSLVEVLVAVVILSVGLLALAALQGALVRGGSGAKAQTQAMALAQQKLEQIRGFVSSTANTDSYTTIVSGTDAAITIGGNTYTRTLTVERYQYQANAGGASGGTFQPVTTNTATVPISNNEFKKVTVAVAWTNESGQTQTAQAADVISVSAPADSLNALATPSSGHRGPQVYIDTSKFAPGIIPIALGNNQSAAASDPQPESFSTGHITTRFSVQNYTTKENTTLALLNKQFDFALTSCTCNMAGASTSANPAYGPTYWNGTKYIAPSTVTGKQTGSDPVSKGNPNNSTQDPILCSACCRDHHDTTVNASTYPVQFDPFRPSTEFSSGDHKHYNVNNSNILQTTAVSTAADTEYYETCRFVRVDGVNYVATDARLENHIVVAPLSPITVTKATVNCDPTGDTITSGTCYSHSLDSTTSGTTYPNFATAYMNAFYTAFQSDSQYPTDEATAIGDLLVSGGSPSSIATTYSTLINPPTQTGISLGTSSSSFMEARGIYIDYIGSETKTAIACIGSTDPDCVNYKSSTLLQILPFVAVNLTYLDAWSSSVSSNSPITVKSDQIPTGNTYDPYITGYTFDRGTATSASTTGSANALAQVRPGNAGLIDSMTVSASYPMEAFTYTSSGSPPVYTYTSNTQFVSDQQPYTVAAAAANPQFTMDISKPSGSAGNNFGTVQPAIQVPWTASLPTTVITTPTTCTKTKNNNPYTCTGLVGATTMLLAFTNYNTNVSCNGKNCPSPPAVNDYKLCSITTLPGTVSQSTYDVVGSGTTNEATYVLLTVSSGSPDSIVNTLALTANFVAQATTCP